MINIAIKSAKKITGAKDSAFVDFPYNEELIANIKNLPKRFWHPQQKQWEIELESIPDIIKFAGNTPITLTGQNETYVPLYKSAVRSNRKLPDLNLKTVPMKHQIEAAEYAINNNVMFLGDEPGLGKTFTATITALARRELDGYKHALIVCGVNILKWNWYKDIKKHTHEEPYILGMRANRNRKVTIGGNKEKLYDIEHLPDNYFLITNIESLRDEDIVEALVRQIKKGNINQIIFDESHKACSPGAKQTKGLHRLQAECRISMTGTPMMNNPLDLWSILYWLGKERHSFYQFKKYYAVMGGYGGYEVVSYKHLDDLQKDLDSVMVRRYKKDILDLPDKIFTEEYVEMEEDQAALYSQIYNYIASNLDKVILSPNPLTAMLRLRQCTSNPKILTSQTISCAKLDRLDDILYERTAAGDKCLVVSNWTEVTDELFERYAKYNPAVITGQVKDQDRQAEEEKLNNDPSCKIMIGTIGAVGTGLTLTAANTVILVDQPWNWSMYTQMSDRIHRIGMGDKAEIITLITKDTIDERINELIYEKKELSDYIVDGKLTGNKRDIIKFLMS